MRVSGWVGSRRDLKRARRTAHGARPPRPARSWHLVCRVLLLVSDLSWGPGTQHPPSGATSAPQLGGDARVRAGLFCVRETELRVYGFLLCSPARGLCIQTLGVPCEPGGANWENMVKATPHSCIVFICWETIRISC